VRRVCSHDSSAVRVRCMGLRACVWGVGGGVCVGGGGVWGDDVSCLLVRLGCGGEWALPCMSMHSSCFCGVHCAVSVLSCVVMFLIFLNVSSALEGEDAMVNPAELLLDAASITEEAELVRLARAFATSKRFAYINHLIRVQSSLFVCAAVELVCVWCCVWGGSGVLLLCVVCRRSCGRGCGRAMRWGGGGVAVCFEMTPCGQRDREGGGGVHSPSLWLFALHHLHSVLLLSVWPLLPCYPRASWVRLCTGPPSCRSRWRAVRCSSSTGPLGAREAAPRSVDGRGVVTLVMAWCTRAGGWQRSYGYSP
jgi:hypothetical protein